ncbi:putative ELMO domain-containing protein [Helianthus annuus]|uniref:ELMO domain-containing protein n=1 Tax=Helianthus annuus TaxID=4232 RepID=A0A9K3DHP0_HELAN|nr:putative ELMO domain-containing protein [Helianthus annuus]KAJ0428387.1 putative ELMO domain-containing protein [Helianthus annuus]KAJ0432456.1 putative ELMO domain-containing protein [Helianthus annuus]KAJ0812242.1 putative ELMO domain-containing protein [Helianthus annuus]
MHLFVIILISLLVISLMRLKHRKCIPSCSSNPRVVDEDDYHWTHNKSNILAWLHKSLTRKSEIAQCIATAMVGPRTWLGGIFNRTGPKSSGSNKYVDFNFTSVQVAGYQSLRERTKVPYDDTRVEHQKALLELWNLAYPNVPLKGLVSDQWKDMGWQGVNPSTDFRGGGFLSLENLLFFAKTFPNAFRRLLLKQLGKRATWEYPFAVAGINISFMLTDLLELYRVKPRYQHCINFVKILGEDEDAFDVLYCIAFVLMDAQWLAMRATYMEFNEVLQVTRAQLQRELALEDIYRIQDLPAFNLLHS